VAQTAAPDRAGATSAPFRVDRMEWAGAFGDLGTLIPFLAAYAALAGVALTPEAIFAATLATGAFWLAMGLTGMARRVGEWIGRPVVVGLVLGLGLAFMLEGVRMMAPAWWIGVPALAVALRLLESRAFPAMFFLLATGVVVAPVQQPDLAAAIAEVRPAASSAAWPLAGLTWDAFVVGVLFIAVPQVPLTLGNAIIGVTEAHNRLFPKRPQSESRFAVSTGLINLGGGLVGWVKP
jgi:hypothetical protein